MGKKVWYSICHLIFTIFKILHCLGHFLLSLKCARDLSPSLSNYPYDTHFSGLKTATLPIRIWCQVNILLYIIYVLKPNIAYCIGYVAIIHAKSIGSEM